MKKVFLGMLVIVLGFGTMSLTTVNKQKVVEVVNSVDGVTRLAPWNSCCESPITAIERDLIARGLPVTTNYVINSTTSTSVTYTIY